MLYSTLSIVTFVYWVLIVEDVSDAFQAKQST